MSTQVDRNDKLISDDIVKETKRFETLDKTFSKLSKSEKDSFNKRKEAFEAIDKIQDENAYVNSMYTIFRKSMSDLEKTRQTKIEKLDKTIIPAIKYYPTKLRDFRQKLNEIKGIQNSIQTHEKNIEKAKTKSDGDMLRKAEEGKHKDSQKKVIAGNALEKDYVDFEANRVDDNKAVLLHFIHSELAYHATAMQTLTKLYQEINILEPKEKLKDFIQKYNLNSMRDFNLQDNYKFKEGETERRIQEFNSKGKVSKPEESKKGKYYI